MILRVELQGLTTEDLVILAGLLVGDAPKAMIRTDPFMSSALAEVVQEDSRLRADKNAAANYDLPVGFVQQDPAAVLEGLQAAYGWLTSTVEALEHEPAFRPALGVLASVAAQIKEEVEQRWN